MYCATCGSLIDEKLNYCNRCGMRVAKGELVEQSDLTVSLVENLSIVTGVVALGGLGGLIGLIAILVVHAGPELIAIISILFLLTTFGICFLLIRQISRLTDKMLLIKENADKKSVPEQLNAPAGGQIEAPREPFLSVTENTTRTLDKTNV